MSSRKLTPFRKKYLNFQTAEKRRKLKLEAIEYKGGACIRCGYNKCPAAMVFHHTDPSQKDFGISHGGRLYKNLAQIQGELDKCVLLCSNCHLETHFELSEENRLLKMQEIENEKRKFSPSIETVCDTCFSPIRVFASAEKQNKFCSIECKSAYFLHEGWPSYDEFQIMKRSFVVKEISEKLGKPLSSTYDRIKRMNIILTPEQQLILKSFMDDAEHNNNVDENVKKDEPFSWRTMKKYRRPDDQNRQVLENYGLIKRHENTLFYEITESGYSLYRNLSISFVEFLGDPWQELGNSKYSRNVIIDIFGHKYHAITIRMSKGFATINNINSQNQADDLYKKIINGNNDLEHWLLWNKMECQIPNVKYQPGIIGLKQFNRIYYSEYPIITLLQE